MGSCIGEGVRSTTTEGTRLRRGLRLFSKVSVSTRVRRTAGTLSRAQQGVSQTLGRDRQVLSSVSSRRRQVTRYGILLGECGQLSSRCGTSVRELSLVTRNRRSCRKVGPPLLYPCYSGPVAPHGERACVRSTHIAVREAVSRLGKLISARGSIRRRGGRSRDGLRGLGSRHSSLSTGVGVRLEPRRSGRVSVIHSCGTCLRIATRVNIVRSCSTSFNQSLGSVRGRRGGSGPTRCRPGRCFPSSFIPTVSKCTRRVLRRYRCSKLLGTGFSLAGFSVIIGNRSGKADRNGNCQSCLGAIVVLVLEGCLTGRTGFGPKSFVVSAPLRNFSSNISRSVPSDVHTKLCQCFVTRRSRKRLVVVRGLSRVPRLSCRTDSTAIAAFRGAGRPNGQCKFLGNIGWVARAGGNARTYGYASIAADYSDL